MSEARQRRVELLLEVDALNEHTVFCPVMDSPLPFEMAISLDAAPEQEDEVTALMHARFDSPRDWMLPSMMQVFAPCLSCQADAARWMVSRYLFPLEWETQVHCNNCRKMFRSPPFTVRFRRQAFRFAWIRQEG